MNAGIVNVEDLHYGMWEAFAKIKTFVPETQLYSAQSTYDQDRLAEVSAKMSGYMIDANYSRQSENDVGRVITGIGEEKLGEYTNENGEVVQKTYYEDYLVQYPKAVKVNYDFNTLAKNSELNNIRLKQAMYRVFPSRGYIYLNLLPATATITFGNPVEGDTVTLDANVFTFSALPGLSNFANVQELTSLIDALNDFSASFADGIITITTRGRGFSQNDFNISSVSADGLDVIGFSGGFGKNFYIFLENKQELGDRSKGLFETFYRYSVETYIRGYKEDQQRKPIKTNITGIVEEVGEDLNELASFTESIEEI